MSSAVALVSIVIPAYNAGPYLRETIESVLSQTYPHIEVIVVDDGSTDETMEIATSFGKEVKYLHQPNSGVSAAKNNGILHSSGAYLNCLDADDVIDSEKIALQVEFLEAHQGVPIAFTDYLNFTGSPRSGRTHFQSCPALSALLESSCPDGVIPGAAAAGVLVAENFTIGSSPLYRRDALGRVGLYDTSLSQGEDFEFHYRFAKRYPIGVLRRALLYRRLHDCNASSQLHRLKTKAGRSREKILLYEDDPHLRKKLKGWLLELYLSVAYSNRNSRRWEALAVTLHSLRYGLDLRQATYTCKILLAR